MVPMVVPVVGSKGYYDFLSPFNLSSDDKIEYVCQGIRTISDYLSNNEDPKALIYAANGIADAVWEEDVANDSYIASFQSGNGHWLYVPCRFIQNYPGKDGIQYQSSVLAFSLPPTPVAQDLSVIMAEVKDVIEGRLGLVCSAREVKTSKIIYVSDSIHETKKQERAQAVLQGNTSHARILALQNQNTALLNKVAELEAYILANL